MDPEIRAVLAAVAALAAERGWAPAAAFAGGLLRGDPARSLLLLVATGVDAAPFARWLAAHSMPPPPQESLEDLVRRLDPAVQADRLIALFECGRLIEPDAAEAVLRAFFTRPPGTYAIVLTGAEQIETDRDLDLIERTAWRLLVPEAQREPHPPPGQLSGHAVYLWSAAAPDAIPPPVRPHVAADQERLAAWLAAPAPAAGPVAAGLARYRATYALMLAEDAMRAPTAGQPAAGPSAEARRVYDLGRGVGDLQERVLGRLEATAATVERSLLASLESLRLEMTQGLRPMLADSHFAERAGPLSDKLLTQLLEGYIARHLKTWTVAANKTLATYETEAIASTRELLDLVDWRQVDAIAAGDGRPTPAIRSRLERLIAPSPTRPAEVAQEASGALARHPGGGLQDPRDGGTVARAAMGGAAVGLGSALLGFGPIGLVLGVGVGAGAAHLERKNRVERNLAYSLQFGRAAVDEVVDRAAARVHELRGRMDDLRAQLAAEFGAVQSTLERAVAQAPPIDPARVVRQADRQHLEDLRIRLAPLTSAEC